MIFALPKQSKVMINRFKYWKLSIILSIYSRNNGNYLARVTEEHSFHNKFLSIIRNKT